MRMTVRMAVRVTVGMAVGMIMLVDMVPNDFPQAATTFMLAIMLMVMLMTLFRRAVMRMLRMRHRRVERMSKLGAHVRLFRSFIRIAPTLALQMEGRRGQQFLKRGRPALGTIPQRIRTQLLQDIKTVAAGFASVIKYRHGNCWLKSVLRVSYCRPPRIPVLVPTLSNDLLAADIPVAPHAH